MADHIYRLNSIESWRIGAIEHWLGDMAAEGKHLTDSGGLWQFETAEPRRTRYRIEIGEKPTEEKQELYAASGWRLVCHNGMQSIFCCDDSHAPELYTDPTEQGYTVAWLQKKLRFSNRMLFLALLLFFGMMAGVFFFSETPTLAFVEGQRINQLLLCVVELYVAVTSLRSVFAYRRLRRQLQSGEPIDHNAPYRKIRAANTAITMAFSLLAVLAMVIPFWSIAQSERIILDGTRSDLVLQLGELENDTALCYPASEYDNMLYVAWSPMVRRRYVSNERMREPNNAEGYSPSLVVRYYEPYGERIADRLLEDLTERYWYRPDGELQELEYPNFDRLLLSGEEGSTLLFARSGRQVAMVRYFGKADAEAIIKQLRNGMASQRPEGAN